MLYSSSMENVVKKTPSSISTRRLFVYAFIAGVLVLFSGELMFRLYDVVTGNEIDRRRQLIREELKQEKYMLTWSPHTGFIPNPGYGNGLMKINEDGYRGRLAPQQKSPGTLRLIALGGSTTMMADLPLEETYPEILRGKLAEYLKPTPVEVINAACNAYTTAESLTRLSLDLVDYEPDYVLIMHVINDLRANWYKGFRSDYSHIFRRPIRFYEETPLGKVSLKISYLCSHSVMCFASMPKGLTRSKQRVMQREKSEIKYPSVKAFQRNLRSMVAISRSVGAKPILATLAISFTPENPPPRETMIEFYRPPNSVEEFTKGLQLHNDAVRELAMETATPLVDIAKIIPPSSKYFVDECHLNALGAKIVAEEFFRVIKTTLPSR